MEEIVTGDRVTESTPDTNQELISTLHGDIINRKFESVGIQGALKEIQ